MCFELTEENYFSPEMSCRFVSNSQFKAFMECEAAALEELRGNFKRENTTALLVGSFVDEYFSGNITAFKDAHPEIFLKNGELKAEFRRAETMINRVEHDEKFMKYLSGEPQHIMTGRIEGVPVKIKMDSYHPGKCIVDLKTVEAFSDIWKGGKKVPFVEAWGYDIQGAIYQEVVHQNTGVRLPFIIAAVTKEPHPDIALLAIPQDALDTALDKVKASIQHIQSVKAGGIPPHRCGKCNYCKDTKKLTEIIDYRDLNMED
jgi:hypothetical protein